MEQFHQRSVSNRVSRKLELPMLPILSEQSSPRFFGGSPSGMFSQCEESLPMPQDVCGVQIVANFFEVLHRALLEGPVSVQIPETLFVSEDGHECLLFNEGKRSLRAFETGDVLAQFFTQCSQTSPSECRAGAPPFVFNSANSGAKVLFDPCEAEKVWKGSKEQGKYLQRFVTSHCVEPTKFRLIWKRSGEIKCFRIQKKVADCLFKGRKTQRCTSFNSLASAFKHDLGAFSHAGQLKKSSFSPLLPFRSVLAEEISQKHKKPSTPRPANTFLVSTRSPGEFAVDLVTSPMPKAERYSQVLREVLQRFFVRNDEIIDVLAYDVIQGSNDEHYLTNVKWIVVGKCPEEATKSPSPCKSFCRAMSSTSDHDRNLRKKFSEVVLSSPLSSLKCKGPFINMEDIRAQHAKTYLSRLPALPLRILATEMTAVDPLLPLLRNSLDSAERNLNRMLGVATTHRNKTKERETVRLAKYNPQMLDQILTKVCDRIRVDPELRGYFKGKDMAQISMVKLSFAKAFSCADNFNFRRNVRRKHEGMGISVSVFTHFVELFTEVLREEGVHSDDIEILHDYLSKFSSQVVEDEESVY